MNDKNGLFVVQIWERFNHVKRDFLKHLTPYFQPCLYLSYAE